MKLCDTNVISELMRPRPDPGVLAWADGETMVALSVVTVDELYFGLSWRPRAKLLDWLDRFLDERCEILDVTPPIATLAGQLRGRLRARGKIRTQADMWIAATAQHHGLILVTRNRKDFEDCRITILDPFISES